MGELRSAVDSGISEGQKVMEFIGDDHRILYDFICFCFYMVLYRFYHYTLYKPLMFFLEGFPGEMETISLW